MNGRRNRQAQAAAITVASPPHAHTTRRHNPINVTPPQQHEYMNEQLTLIVVGADADNADVEADASWQLDTVTRQIGRRGLAIVRRALLDARLRRASGAAAVSGDDDLAAAA